MQEKPPVEVECGRACIATEHRNALTILMLWKGIQAFMEAFGQRYTFGCCSLTTPDPHDGWRALETIRRAGRVHPSLWLPALEPCRCEKPPAGVEPIALPKLFSAYLRVGARVISEPAIDRAFGTVDFLILMDARSPAMSLMRHAMLPASLLKKVTP